MSGLLVAEAAADAAARRAGLLAADASPTREPVLAGAARRRATCCVVMGAGDIDELARRSRRAGRVSRPTASAGDVRARATRWRA